MTRLRLQAAEAFVSALRDSTPGHWPSHEELREFRELLKDTVATPDLMSAIVEFNQRLAELERALGNEVIRGEPDGIRLG